MIRGILRLWTSWFCPPIDARAEWAFDPSCTCDACEAARSEYLTRCA